MPFTKIPIYRVNKKNQQKKIGYEIGRKPFHKPYDRQYEKRQALRDINEALEDYESDLEKCCEVVDISTREEVQTRLIYEYGKVLQKDMFNSKNRNYVCMSFIRQGYAYAFSQVYEENTSISLKDLTEYLNETTTG